MKQEPPVLTDFAPAERATDDQLVEERERVRAGAVRQVLDACPNPAAVLNASRQIVFCNRALVGMADGLDEQAVWGCRPGEALGCQHSRKTPGGCGTTEFCRTCGAVLAILDGQQGRPSTRECRMTRIVDGRKEALDLRVTVSPMPISDRFVVCAVEDISHETRRRALERVFFHDILNTALALQSHAQTLSSRSASDQTPEALNIIHRAALRLLAEIESQRMLLAAENGELTPRPALTTSVLVMHGVVEQFNLYPIAESNRVAMAGDAELVSMTIDITLLDRVLVNMVKNAVEASRSDEAVTITCRSVPPDVEFSVHNMGTIPREVQLQIFQRSFSTKGLARGLGTYSMKLFTDRYLHGRVWFESSAAGGTTFFLRVPADWHRGDGREF